MKKHLSHPVPAGKIDLEPPLIVANVDAAAVPLHSRH